MHRFDHLDVESELGHPFAVLWIFMRHLYGPLFWPIMLPTASAGRGPCALGAASFECSDLKTRYRLGAKE
ncbi:MAG: hypothetical protein JNM75_07930 [Rhodospirillales bacterium]|nr:hypothetical protein [Rhodospirillales bacterium]